MTALYHKPDPPNMIPHDICDDESCCSVPIMDPFEIRKTLVLTNKPGFRQGIVCQAGSDCKNLPLFILVKMRGNNTWRNFWKCPEHLTEGQDGDEMSPPLKGGNHSDGSRLS